MLNDIRSLHGRPVRFMRQLVDMVDRICDDYPDDPVTIFHDGDGIIRGAIVADPRGGLAIVADGADGAVRIREFQHLEDAICAIEADGMVAYDPFGAIVPRFSALPL